MHAQSMRFPSSFLREARSHHRGCLMTSPNPNHMPEAPPGLGSNIGILGTQTFSPLHFTPAPQILISFSWKIHSSHPNSQQYVSHRPTVKWVCEDPPVCHPSSIHIPTHPFIHSSILPSSLLHPSISSPTHPGNKYLLRKYYVSGIMLPHLFKLCPISILFLPLPLLTFLRSYYVSGTFTGITLSNLLKILSWKGDHVSHFTDGKSTAQQENWLLDTVIQLGFRTRCIQLQCAAPNSSSSLLTFNTTHQHSAPFCR